MKYFATIGPNFNSKEDILEAINLGLTGVRINLSHGSLDDISPWLNNIVEAENESQKDIEIILDIVGPEIRVKAKKDYFIKANEIFEVGSDVLNNKDILVKDALIRAVEVGDILSFDDGLFECPVIQKHIDYISLEALEDCSLKRNKSVAIKGKELNLDLFSEVDIHNFYTSKKYNINSFMQPFVRGKDDVIILREKLKSIGINKTYLYAKIEDESGIKNLEEIIDVCDEVVIARGDLGNNIGLLNVARAQKYISSKCRDGKKNFMVVTQLLNSMIDSKIPTRAELNDIYNSTLDGASSLMITGESAIGKYPIEAIRYLINGSKI